MAGGMSGFAPEKRIADAIVAYVRSPEFEEQAAAEAALVELMEQIRALEEPERGDALLWWARSPYWHTVLMMAEGWHGALAREAWRVLKRNLDADTPGRRWDKLDHGVGRASITRLLGMEGDAGAYYATAPFRSWIDDDQRPWIAGAIGAPPIFGDAAMSWLHLDIREVILWDPRANEVRLAGEHASYAGFVMPDHAPVRLTVWGDGRAFFRAWAAARAQQFKVLQAAARGEWKHPAAELPDSGLPGALLIGSIGRARWPSCDAETVIAGPGLAAGELQAAAIRAANLPSFEGGSRGRGV